MSLFLKQFIVIIIQFIGYVFETHHLLKFCTIIIAEAIIVPKYVFVI